MTPLNRSNLRLAATRPVSLRTVALLSLLFLLFATSASAAPADPFSGATETPAAAAQDGFDFNSSDWGVSQENGAVTYTYGIVVPPGRNGIQPALALRYSSQAPLRGGIAAGWSLDLPLIEPDLSLGVDGGTQYRATLGGASGRLVQVDDKLAYDDAVAAYRVNFDSSYTRFFERRQTVIDRAVTNVTWTALSADGMRHHFTRQPITTAEPRWQISYQEDRFGNRVTYTWTPVSAADGTFLEDRLDRIEYTTNAAAGLVAHAKVEFEYAPLELCNGSTLPVGAAMRRGSLSVDGTHRLTAIHTFARDTQVSDWRLARTVDVTMRLTNSKLYLTTPTNGRAFDCNQNLLRRLDQIDVTAYAPNGVATTQPPLKFSYNSRINTTPDVIVPGDPDPLAVTNVAGAAFRQRGTSGRVISGQTADLIDIDADGINDWVTTQRIGDVCQLKWRKGQLGGTFGIAKQQDLPTAAWYAEWSGAAVPEIATREGCTIGGQIAYRHYEPNDPATSGVIYGKGHVSYHFLDYDGDGKVDLVTNVWATVCHWTYDAYAPRNVGDIEGCAFDSGRAVRVGDEPPVGGTDFIAMSPEEVSPFDGVGGTNNHDYVWRIYKGTGDVERPFETSQFLRGSANPPLPLSPTVGDERLDNSVTQSLAITPMADIDGDGFIDFIDTRDTVITDCVNELPLRGCDWTIYFGDGGINFPDTVDAHVWAVPVSTTASEELLEAICGESGLSYIQSRATVVGMVDMTGDGLSDLVVRDGGGNLNYYLNTGSGFGALRDLGVNVPLDKVQTDCNETVAGNLIDGARGYLRRLVDLDGDGLTDMLYFGDGQVVGDISADLTPHAYFNVGGVFGELTELPAVWQDAQRLFDAEYDPSAENPFYGLWHVARDFTDVNGDGLPDLAFWSDFGLSYISSPGLPDAPDLLRQIDNGRGMVVSFEYNPSSDPATVGCASGACVMPSVRWVATAVAVDPGFGQPTLRTTYGYANPETLSADVISEHPERASFAGFGSVERHFNGGRKIQTDYAYTALNAAGTTVAAPHAEQISEALYEVVGNQNRLRSYQTTSSAGYRLFTGVQVALAELTLSCQAVGNADSTSACLARSDHVLRTAWVWQPRAYRYLDEDPVTCGEVCTGAAADYYNLLATTTGEGSVPVAGDIRITFTKNVRYGQTIIDDSCSPPFIPCVDTELALDDYMVQIARTHREERGAVDTYSMAGLTRTSYADATGLPTRARLYRDSTTYGQTTFIYDTTLGIMTSLRKPAQQTSAGGSGASTTYLHDDHKLFVRESTNELGHSVRVFHDVATGAPLLREGPNRIDPTTITYTLLPSADTYVSQSDPTNNFGTLDHVQAGMTLIQPNFQRLDTLIKFDLTPIAGKQVQSVKLRLFQLASPGNQYPVTLSALRFSGGESWEEGAATFNNYPGGSSGFDRCDHTVNPNVPDWEEWQCGSLFNWLSAWEGGATNNGIRITRHQSAGNRDAAPTFASREHANQPQLVVTVREGPASTVYEQEAWQTDGFGRVLTRSVTFDDPDTGYELLPIEQHTYDDLAYFNSGAAMSMTDYARRDRGGAVWLETTRTLDGIGRSLVQSERIDAGISADTTYFYNNLGTVDRIISPAPHLAAGTVQHSFQYDGLGRLVATTRPDGTGVNYSYDGVTSTTSERTTDGSGGVTTRTVDGIGRLIRVEEQIDTTRATAITTYAYDANNNLREIIDADGNVTTMTHDIASTRTAITRSDRTWHYAYDFNGNLLTEQSPVPDGAAPELYTTTFSYDDLDRTLAVTYADPVITTLPSGIPTATRLRTGAATSVGRHLLQAVALLLIALTFVAVRRQRRVLAVFFVLLTVAALRGTQPVIAETAGVRSAENSDLITIDYVYDLNLHGIGRLSQITTPLGNATSNLVSTYQYDARGLPIGEARSLTLTGVATLNSVESVERSYNVLGALTHSRWHDGQEWAIDYDERGLIKTVSWLDSTTATWRAVADYTRNVAGLPTLRATDFSQEQAYGYDNLARPATMQVNAGASLDLYAQRGYLYSDSGDLLAVTGSSDGLDAGATYQYDSLHRLTNAAGPAGYSGDFTYSAAGNVLSVEVSGLNSAENRNVTYSYGISDPQAVDQLTNVVGGTTYGSFAYDAAGNMIRRNVPNATSWLTWDAANQIRLAVTQDGSELYLYDAAGARIAAVSSQDGIRTWFAERESHYTLDGTPLQTYLHPTGGGATLARVEDGVTIELQYADALQNLMFSLDADGLTTARFLYGAFGEVVFADGSADHRRQFNGKENDVVTGLRYYGFRYYDPVTLRWNSADPLYRLAPDIGTGNPQRLNLYSFSLNNPIRYYDPDGRDADDGLDPDDQVCTIEEQADQCTLDNAAEETADSEGNSEDSTVREVLDGAAASTKAKAGAGSGVENNERKKAEKPKPSISVGKSVSAISVAGEKTFGPGKVKASIEALKAGAEAECSSDECKVSGSLELVNVEGCGEVCTPIPFTDYESCVEACVGAGVGVGGEVGTGGFKFGAKAGIGGNVGVSVKKRSDSEEWTLYYDEFQPTHYKKDGMESPLHTP